jgi:uncharacterized membrane protein YqjE
MSDTPSGARDAPPGGGLVASLRRLCATLIEILQTRLELLATEYEEERAWLRSLLVYALVAVFFLAFGTLLLTLFVILLFWDEYRLIAVGGVAFFYLLLGLGAWALLRAKARNRPRFLSSTIAELGKDRAALRPRP